MDSEITEYLAALKKTLSQLGNEPLKEDNFRTDFENFLRSIVPQNITIVQELTAGKKGFGVPDFRVSRSGASIGYIETKSLGDDLESVLQSKQIEKYKRLTDNLLLTDYGRFIHIRQGVAGNTVTLFNGKKELQQSSATESIAFEEVERLLRNFLSQSPSLVSEPEQVAERLAFWASEIRYLVEEYLIDKETSDATELRAVFEGFKQELLRDTNEAKFADVFAQTLTYGLFLSRLNSVKPIDLQTVLAAAPQGVPLLNDFFKTVNNPHTTPERLQIILADLIATLNNIDGYALEKNLTQKAADNPYQNDAYIYFYEDFLRLYDNEIRVQKGAFYTPKAAVTFITRSVSELLAQQLDLQGGLASEQVKLLDFAAGTGTFLLSVFEDVFAEKSKLGEQGKKLAKEHLLKNVYGFELMPAPYMVAHLKLTEFMKSVDAPLDKKERFKIYLTNTLDDEYTTTISALPFITKEGELAQAVKVKEEILVITGNPPYNVRSKNDTRFTDDYLWNYKDGLNEKKLNLDDDYIKFLLFAQKKLESAPQGIVAVVTNNSFIDGVTHRSMRKRLLEAFDEIYILDLHGSVKKKEVAPDGSPDENIFDIEQGVSISFFVKSKSKPKTLFQKDYNGTRKPTTLARVFHADLYGKRHKKYKFLFEHTLGTTKWKELKSVDFLTRIKDGKDNPINFYFFVPFNKAGLARYSDEKSSLCLTDIFANYGSGIITRNDDITIQFKQEDIERVVKDFIALDEERLMKKYRIDPKENKKSPNWKVEWAKADLQRLGFQRELVKSVMYKAFDYRWTFYSEKSNGFLSRPLYDTMRHLFKPNLALSTVRQMNLDADWSHAFITKRIATDRNMLSVSGAAYLFPLYVYKNGNVQGFDFDELNFDADGKMSNFKTTFVAFLRSRYPKKQPSPEQVMAYIYGVLHSPGYRAEYADYLAISFPFIPFVDQWKTFEKIASLGQALIDAHLLDKRLPSKFILAGKGNNFVEKLRREGNKLHINSTQFFEGASDETLDFEIGGYKVIEKYLAYRKGREITSDLEHLQ